MTHRIITRRTVLKGAAGAAIAGFAAARPRPARAADKIRFLTNFYAEEAFGGNYQAQATGLYQKAGLDVDIRQGGPQLNAMQLLLGGEVDVIMGKDITVLSSIEKSVPVITVAASYQWELQGLMTHPDINAITDLKNRKILISSSGRTNYWPWLKKRFNFSDEQAMPYTNNLQPFIVDKTTALVALASDEPYIARKEGEQVKFFPFLREGWPPYGAPLVTTHDFLAKNRDVMARFVRASLEGWKGYFADPAPGNALIKRDNPKQTDDLMGFALQTMKDLKVVHGGDAETMGIGIMTEARWQKTRDFMVEFELLKPSTDWKSAFTTEFVKDLHIMMG